MEEFKYIKRIAEKELLKKIRTSGCVLIAGPKYCGKTTTAEQFAKSSHSFSTLSKINLYSSNIKMALIGEAPTLIDEWQNIPLVWDEIRDEIDRRHGKFGQYILTGSIHPIDYDEIMHSGEGRFSKVVMYPFSLFESGESSGNVSLNNLFNKKDNIFFNEGNQTLLDIAYYICRGGWPTSLNVDKEDSLEIAKNYLFGIINYKNKEKKQYFANTSTASYILKSYARNISTEVAFTTLLKDINEHDGIKYDDETLTSYIEKFKNLFVIDDIESWNPNLRSETSIRTKPTRHFVDPSLATVALGISPDDLLNDFNTFGLFFEDLVVRDLKVYSQAINASVAHYRDNDGLECDAIIHKTNGDWGALEIKLGGKELIDKACSKLLALKNKIDYTRFKKPSFLAVITATGSAMTTKDGIHIIPITMLKD